MQHWNLENRTGDPTVRNCKCGHVNRQWSHIEVHRKDPHIYIQWVWFLPYFIILTICLISIWRLVVFQSRLTILEDAVNLFRHRATKIWWHAGTTYRQGLTHAWRIESPIRWPTHNAHISTTHTPSIHHHNAHHHNAHSHHTPPQSTLPPCTNITHTPFMYHYNAHSHHTPPQRTPPQRRHAGSQSLDFFYVNIFLDRMHKWNSSYVT